MKYTNINNTRRTTLLIFLIIYSLAANSQYVINGKVIDEDTKEGLVGVNIIVSGTNVGTATDENSRFELKYSKPIQKIVCSYTGYATQEIEVTDKEITIKLKQTTIELDQVIVSASRSQQERKDAPVAMTKIQTQELGDLKANFHGQVLTQVSSVHFADFGNEQQSMSIRQPLSFSRTQTIILEDGVPIGPTSLTSSSALSDINIEAVKSVEVLRGPTSSLYGSEAIGGAVNYNTKNPSLIPSANIGLQMSNLGYKKASFGVSNTYKKTGLLLSGYYAQRRNGYRDYSDMDKLSMTLKMVHTFSYKTKLTLISTYNDFNVDFTGGLDSLQFYTDDAFNKYTFCYASNKQLRSTLRLDHFWNEKSKSFFTIFHRKYNEEEVPSYRIKLTGTYPAFKYLGEFVKSDYQSIGAIFQHKLKFDLLNSSLIGGLSLDFTPENYYSEVIDVTKSAEGIYTDYTMTGQEIQDFQANLMNSAAYLYFETFPLEKLKLIMALRYDRLDYYYDNHLAASDASGAADTRNNFNHLSPKIGLTYEIAKNIGAYTNYSVGFAPPLFNQLYKTVKVPVLEPSVYSNYEIGGWVGFLKNKGYFDFAFYQSDGVNEIVEVYEAGALISKSVGQSSHKGVEYSIKYEIIKGLSIRYSASHALHTFVDSFTGYAGNEMSIAPKYIGNAGITYKPSFLKGFRIGAEMQKVGAYYMDEINSEMYDGYMIFNLRLGYEIKGIEAWLNILNATDELYATRVSKSYYGNPMNPIVSRSYSPGIHRTFLFGLGYNISGK